MRAAGVFVASNRVAQCLAGPLHAGNLCGQRVAGLNATFTLAAHVPLFHRLMERFQSFGLVVARRFGASTGGQCESIMLIWFYNLDETKRICFEGLPGPRDNNQSSARPPSRMLGVEVRGVDLLGELLGPVEPENDPASTSCTPMRQSS